MIAESVPELSGHWSCVTPRRDRHAKRFHFFLFDRYTIFLMTSPLSYSYHRALEKRGVSFWLNKVF